MPACATQKKVAQPASVSNLFLPVPDTDLRVFLEEVAELARFAPEIITAIAELPEIWSMVQAGVRDMAPAEGQAAFDTAVRDLSATLGVEFDRLMNSLSDEWFLALRLSVQDTVGIPMGDTLHTIPSPSVLIGVALKDDTLPAMIDALIAKQAEAGAAMPIVTTQDADVTLHSLAVPLPAMAAARERARRTAEMSALRQI